VGWLDYVGYSVEKVYVMDLKRPKGLLDLIIEDPIERRVESIIDWNIYYALFYENLSQL
jgi:hypothetical protein